MSNQSCMNCPKIENQNPPKIEILMSNTALQQLWLNDNQLSGKFTTITSDHS